MKEFIRDDGEPIQVIDGFRERGVKTCRSISPKLARIIHERFCCNRAFAATTRLRLAGSPLAPSTYCSSTPRSLTAPRARLATRLRDFATNRHE